MQIYSKSQFKFNSIKRQKELDLLNKLYNNKSNSCGLLIGIDGRRRVGKTYFVNDFINRKEKELNDENIFDGYSFISPNVIRFEFIGNNNNSSRENILEAINKVKNVVINLDFIDFKSKKEIIVYNDSELNKRWYTWIDFFDYFRMVINKINNYAKNNNLSELHYFIFFDEISWYDAKSKFINAFSNIWNDFLNFQKNTIVFIASSSSTWINDKIFKNTKSLYARINLKIKLEPFKINEIYDYLKIYNKNININDVIKYYSMFGGIIKYYDFIDFNKSYSENLDFIKNNRQIFDYEYDILFNGLFSSKKWHKQIIELICKSKTLTFDEIKQKLQKYKKEIHNTDIYVSLNELVDSGFLLVSKFDSKNIYMLNDLFCYFYYYWFILNGNRISDINNKDNYYLNWQGVSFEIVILNHLDLYIPQINKLNSRIYLNWNNNKKNLKNKKQVDILININNEKFNENHYIIVEIKSFNENKRLTYSEFEKIEEKADAVFDYYEKDTNKKVSILIISLNKIVISKSKEEMFYDLENFVFKNYFI